MSRREEFRWMMLRIKRMEDPWINAIRALAAKQNLAKRKKVGHTHKHVLMCTHSHTYSCKLALTHLHARTHTHKHTYENILSTWTREQNQPMPF